MYSVVTSGAVRGIASYLIRVEVDCTEGLPLFSMVGFAGGEVREAGERVRVAMRNSGFDMEPRRITVNLAPANIPKRGIVIDLPIALGLLISLREVPLSAAEGTLVLGELGLDGEIRAVRGVLAIVKMAADTGVPLCILPMDNLSEGRAVSGVRCVGVRSLRELVRFLTASREEQERIMERQERELLLSGSGDTGRQKKKATDLSAVRGQEQGKRALEIAAAGYHNLYMSGPPGTGKSLLASCLPGLLPPMDEKECLEVSSVYSVAGRLEGGLIRERPFVAPHHTVTRAALIGGGSIPGPGAISLAHNGVLFLDEMPEFGRIQLDLLRQPMEEHEIRITRNYGTYRFPARFLLVGAGNPCPCGYYPDKQRCQCTEPRRMLYQQRISGPLMDRIDLRIHVKAPHLTELQKEQETTADGAFREESPAVRQRVAEAAERQHFRYAKEGISFNAELSAQDTERYCRLGTRERRFVRELLKGSAVSARSYHRILRIARTIADLDGSERILEDHLAEACMLRGTE